MIAQWLKDELDANHIKPTKDLQYIMAGIDKIRTDILLDKANRG
jgi:hypothetical protein